MNLTWSSKRKSSCRGGKFDLVAGSGIGNNVWRDKYSRCWKHGISDVATMRTNNMLTWENLPVMVNTCSARRRAENDRFHNLSLPRWCHWEVFFSALFLWKALIQEWPRLPCWTRAAGEKQDKSPKAGNPRRLKATIIWMSQSALRFGFFLLSYCDDTEELLKQDSTGERRRN